MEFDLYQNSSHAKRRRSNNNYNAVGRVDFSHLLQFIAVLNLCQMAKGRAVHFASVFAAEAKTFMDCSGSIGTTPL